MSSELDAMVESLLADDVVLAVSRARRGAELKKHQRDALTRAATILKFLSGARDVNVQTETHSDSQLRELVDVGDSAQRIARTMGRSGDDESKRFFGELYETAASVAGGPSQAVNMEGADNLIAFFQMLSQVTQTRGYAEMNDVGQPAWMLWQPTGVS